MANLGSWSKPIRAIPAAWNEEVQHLDDVPRGTKVRQWWDARRGSVSRHLISGCQDTCDSTLTECWPHCQRIANQIKKQHVAANTDISVRSTMTWWTTKTPWCQHRENHGFKVNLLLDHEGYFSIQYSGVDIPCSMACHGYMSPPGECACSRPNLQRCVCTSWWRPLAWRLPHKQHLNMQCKRISPLHTHAAMTWKGIEKGHHGISFFEPESVQNVWFLPIFLTIWLGVNYSFQDGGW